MPQPNPTRLHFSLTDVSLSSPSCLHLVSISLPSLKLIIRVDWGPLGCNWHAPIAQSYQLIYITTHSGCRYSLSLTAIAACHLAHLNLPMTDPGRDSRPRQEPVPLSRTPPPSSPLAAISLATQPSSLEIPNEAGCLDDLAESTNEPKNGYSATQPPKRKRGGQLKEGSVTRRQLAHVSHEQKVCPSPCAGSPICADCFSDGAPSTRALTGLKSYCWTRGRSMPGSSVAYAF